MPATSTDCPWPGVTACPVVRSAYRRIGFSWMNGKRKRWLVRITELTAPEMTSSARIAAKSRQWSLIARFT